MVRRVSATWPSSWTVIWRGAGGSVSSVTSRWTAAVLRSWWSLSGWCLMISPQKKNFWHYCPERQLPGELTSITQWGSLWCRWKGWYQWLRMGLLLWVGRHAGFIAHCKGDADFPNFLHYRCIIHQQILMCQSGRLWTRDDSRRKDHKRHPCQS